MLEFYFIAFLHAVSLGDYPINIKEFTPISINGDSVSFFSDNVKLRV